MGIESKTLNGLERISEVLKSLLWEKAKVYKISPMQIQILLFVSNHHQDLCNVSSLAKEFRLTKATISDAVRVLLDKKMLQKDFSPIDKRRFDLLITDKGAKITSDLADYSIPLRDSLAHLSEKELANLFETISKLIFQLNQAGVIKVQRTCFNCQYYKGNKKNSHFCNLLDKRLKNHDIELDCKEFEDRVEQGAL